MTRANIETVKLALETFVRRADPRVVRPEAVAEWWHRDGRMYPMLLAGGALEGTMYGGYEGIRSFITDVDGGWAQLTLEPLELRDLDERRVLAHIRFSATGESSGAEVVADAWTVVTVRDEKIVEWRTFPDEADALSYHREGGGAD